MDTKKIEEMIRVNPQEGILPCPVAHYIAVALGVTPKEVGDTATAIKVKLDLCQLGLFGYGRKGISDYKNLGRPVKVPGETLTMIRAAEKLDTPKFGTNGAFFHDQQTILYLIDPELYTFEHLAVEVVTGGVSVAGRFCSAASIALELTLLSK